MFHRLHLHWQHAKYVPEIEIERIRSVTRVVLHYIQIGGCKLSGKYIIDALFSMCALVEKARDSAGSIIEEVDHSRGAGIYLIKPLAETTVEELEKILATNARGVFLGMNHFAPFVA